MDNEKHRQVDLYLIANPDMIWHLYEMGGYLEEFFANTSIVLIPFVIIGISWMRGYGLQVSDSAGIVVFIVSAVSALLLLAAGVVFYESIGRELLLYASKIESRSQKM